jgi:hypothetical protein
MFKKETLSIVLSILLPCFSTALANAPDAILKIDVEVNNDATIATELVSYFSRALQRIGDIEITKVNPDIVIHCSALPIKPSDGRLLGYAISTTFTSSMSSRLLGLRPKLAPGANTDEIFCNTTTSVTGPTLAAVEGEVERIVDSADGDIFQGEREQRQVIKDWPNRSARTQTLKQD